MRRCLVVYESMYGNTREVAEAVGAGLDGMFVVEVLNVGDAPNELSADTAMLVVAAPTHVFGLPNERTRADAAKRGDGPGVAAQLGVREWLERLAPRPGIAAVAMTTLVEEPRWIRSIGSANRGIEAALKRLGFELIADGGRFFVASANGPLLTGELERARNWGATLFGDLKVRESIMTRRAKSAPVDDLHR